MDQTTLEYHAVAKTSDLGEDDVIPVTVGKLDIALYNVAGEYFATDGICTHEYVGLSDGWVEGEVIECPLHGGCFNIKTGKALKAPTTVDLKTYPVKVEGDTVYIGIAPGEERC